MANIRRRQLYISFVEVRCISLRPKRQPLPEGEHTLGTLRRELGWCSPG